MNEIKKQWILNYMLNHQLHKDEFIDITAEPFVNAYVDEFKPEIVEWYKDGYPRWFYIYKINVG